MFSVEYELPSVAPDEERAVEAQADDVESLLEAWLSELLWTHDATGFVPGAVSVHDVGPVAAEGSPVAVRGTAGGRLIGDWFEQTGPQIKAVTFHGLQVRRVNDHWEATVYLDV